MPVNLLKVLEALIHKGEIAEAISLAERDFTAGDGYSYQCWIQNNIPSEALDNTELLNAWMHFALTLSQSPACNELDTYCLSRTPLKIINQRFYHHYEEDNQNKALLINFVNHFHGNANNITLIELVHELIQTLFLSYDAKLLKNKRKTLHLSENASIPNFSTISSDINNILSVISNCSPEESQHLEHIMIQLLNGFGMIRNSDENTAATYVFAAVRHFKSAAYEFLPTVLDANKFSTYLKSVAELPYPVCERFVLIDPHWRSGEIEITSEGHVNIFILNSTGYLEEHDLMRIKFHQIFKDKPVHLFFANEMRQFSDLGCSVFALDDVRHFYTLDKYSVEGKTLFEQLNARITQSETIANHVIRHHCRLPVSLMRTMQSRRVFEDIEPEQDLPINKYKLTADQSIRESFIESQADGVIQNKRLDMKLNKMAIKVSQLIIDCLKQDPINGYDTLTSLAEEHTLSAFQLRVKSITANNTPISGRHRLPDF